MQIDASDDLLVYYAAEPPVTFQIAGNALQLPLACLVQATASGRCDAQRLTLLILPGHYDMPAVLQAYTRPIIEAAAGRGHHNGDVVRLNAARTDGGHTLLELRRASYFDALATNFAMEHRPEGAGASLRDLLHGMSRRLTPLADDVLVNHIGIVCMVETADGQLVVQRRSDKVANRHWTRSASASGVLEYRDIMACASRGQVTLMDLSRAASREIEEELGVSVPELAFLGIFREFLRGGKPECYFYGKSPLSWPQVEAAHAGAVDTAESISIEALEFTGGRSSPAESIEAAAARIDRQVASALRTLAGTANLTLIAGILLTAEHAKKPSVSA